MVLFDVLSSFSKTAIRALAASNFFFVISAAVSASFNSFVKFSICCFLSLSKSRTLDELLLSKHKSYLKLKNCKNNLKVNETESVTNLMIFVQKFHHSQKFLIAVQKLSAATAVSVLLYHAILLVDLKVRLLLHFRQFHCIVTFILFIYNKLQFVIDSRNIYYETKHSIYLLRFV